MHIYERKKKNSSGTITRELEKRFFRAADTEAFAIFTLALLSLMTFHDCKYARDKIFSLLCVTKREIIIAIKWQTLYVVTIRFFFTASIKNEMKCISHMQIHSFFFLLLLLHYEQIYTHVQIIVSRQSHLSQVLSLGIRYQLSQ